MDIFAKKQSPLATAADLLVIPFFEGKKSPLVKRVDEHVDGFLSDLLKDEGFIGKKGEQVIVHTHHRIPIKKVLVIGLGKQGEVTIESLRRMSAMVVNTARMQKSKTVLIDIDPLHALSLDSTASAQAMVEGALLASYQFLKYKGKAKEEAEKQRIREVWFVSEESAAITAFKKGIPAGLTYANATIYARDMVNTPAADMTPRHIAEEAKQLSSIPGVKVTIYNKAEIRKMGLNAFLAVASGSDEDPYFIHLSYKPTALAKKKNAKRLVICGKGITFDSGGLSIKSAHYMEAMKSDMAGAASILAVFRHMHELRPTVEVHGVIATTENMPSGKAVRPGDVVTAYNGKTIEVVNTDAEGRLILCDALAWAEDTLKPDYMIDLATLTGAAIVALGQEVAAMMGTSRLLLNKYKTASEVAGEPTWELPLVEEYKDLVKSQIADLTNLCKLPWAGSIIGGLFLAEFVKTPWMHVDIAGPAWIEKQLLPYAPYGASGFSVRTVMNLVQSL